MRHPYKTVLLFASIIIIGIAIPFCFSDNKKNPLWKMNEENLGRNIELSLDSMAVIIEGEIINTESESLEQIDSKEGIILTVINRDICMACSLKQLYVWDAAADSIGRDTFNFVFIVCPDSTYRVNDIAFILSQNYFSFPVYVDDKGVFSKANSFLPQSLSSSYVLNTQYQIQAFGDVFYHGEEHNRILSIEEIKNVFDFD